MRIEPTAGEKRLAEEMHRQGWRQITTFPPGHGMRGPDKVEAIGRDDTGDVGIHIDAGRDGHVEGYQVHRADGGGGIAEASDRYEHSRGVPTPAEAMGRWEEQIAGEAKRGLR